MRKTIQRQRMEANKMKIQIKIAAVRPSDRIRSKDVRKKIIREMVK